MDRSRRSDASSYEPNQPLLATSGRSPDAADLKRWAKDRVRRSEDFHISHAAGGRPRVFEYTEAQNSFGSSAFDSGRHCTSGGDSCCVSRFVTHDPSRRAVFRGLLLHSAIQHLGAGSRNYCPARNSSRSRDIQGHMAGHHGHCARSRLECMRTTATVWISASPFFAPWRWSMTKHNQMPVPMWVLRTAMAHR